MNSHSTWNLPTGLKAHVDEIEVLDPQTQRNLLDEVCRGREARLRLLGTSLDVADRRRLEAQVRVSDRAVRRLISANLRLVIWVARSAARRQRALELDDLVQEGVTGLIRAIEKFDPSRGTALSTYATWWIRQAISRAIMNAGLVRIPVHVQEGSARTSVSAACARRFHHIASLEAEADTLHFRVADAVADGRIEWLEDDEDLPIEQGTTDEIGEGVGTREVVDLALSHLSPRESMILECRSGMRGDPMTLEEIGRMIGLTRERVRQIEHRALTKSRTMLRDAA